VEQLGTRKEALKKLEHTLNHDPFHAVRQAAARAIRGQQTDEAFAVLQASLKQSDARVRREVAAGLLGFYREAAYDAARKILADEKNPDIQITAIAALAPYPKPETKETLLRYLKSESYRNSLADAAVTAARGQDDATYVAPLLDPPPEPQAARIGRPTPAKAAPRSRVRRLGWGARSAAGRAEPTIVSSVIRSP